VYSNLRLSACSIAAALGLAACTAGQTGPPTITPVNIQSQSRLEFAVGTANLFGTTTGMNVVALFRQTSGFSAVLLNTPTLTGPFTITTPANNTPDANGATFAAGPSPSEAGVHGALAIPSCGASLPPAGGCITGTPQQLSGTPVTSFPYLTTFGITGGVFGTAFAPGNYANGTPIAGSAGYRPYKIPLYDQADANAFAPWGGPPAFDPTGDGKGTRDGTFDARLLGVNMGTVPFAGVTPRAGTYNLNVIVPTSNSTIPFAATFALPAPRTLPVITPPTVSFDGTGQIKVAYTLPAGVVQAYVEVLDPKYCGGGPVYYTFEVTASGTSTVTNQNAPGAPGTTAPAACRAKDPGGPDSVTASVIGFDYDAYSLSNNKPLQSTYPQSPPLPASADVSISAFSAPVTSP